ncbi:hypothetical protein [Actinomadura luteofluorescens]|uniref:hypothetical protein n=1 Tax=Actinomadura luteofluorescens TaxID=46163 RepID=UPI003D8FBFE5
MALNIAIRRHRVAINDLLFALRKGDVSEGIRGELEESRRLYVERHAEAQMTVPWHVLKAAGAVRRHLGTLFSMARRLESGDTRDGDSFDAAFAYGERFWSRIEYLRSAMRFDLGIAEG